MNNPTEDFEDLWKDYPRKLGYKAALRHYTASIKNGASKERIKKALDNYRAYIIRSETEEKYIKHGSTFFNNWRDYENYETNTERESGAAPIPDKYANIQHREGR